MQKDRVVSLPNNPELVSLLVLNMKYHTIVQIHQDKTVTPAPPFLPPPMVIPGTESTKPTLLTRTKAVDKVDVWKLGLLHHGYLIPQHFDLLEAGRRDQACNRDMTTL